MSSPLTRQEISRRDEDDVEWRRQRHTAMRRVIKPLGSGLTTGVSVHDASVSGEPTLRGRGYFHIITPSNANTMHVFVAYLSRRVSRSYLVFTSSLDVSHLVERTPDMFRSQSTRQYVMSLHSRLPRATFRRLNSRLDPKNPHGTSLAFLGPNSQNMNAAAI